MAGAEAQAGFYYQNVVAANYALDLLEFGSSLRSILHDFEFIFLKTKPCFEFSLSHNLPP